MTPAFTLEEIVVAQDTASVLGPIVDDIIVHMDDAAVADLSPEMRRSTAWGMLLDTLAEAVVSGDWKIGAFFEPDEMQDDLWNADGNYIGPG